MPLAAGTRLGPYEVLAPLGAGGMGEVYRARDPRLGRDVALKVLPSAFSTDPKRLVRFEQEARAAAALNHPNILAVHDVGQHGRSPYIVSELLEGQTLRERLDDGALPVRKAIEYAVQIAHGLAAAHEKAIVHRDLKPENIFIASDGRVKILDFGLAKLTQGEPIVSGISALPMTPTHTQAGIVLGTVGYMSPEQVRGLAADHRSDIFAFGAVLYEMLSGRRAFQGDSSADTMTAVLNEDPPDLPSTERHIPPAIERVVRRCIEKVSAERFQSTRDLAFAIEALSTQSTQANTVDGRERRLNLRQAASVVVTALLASALTVAGVTFWRPTARSAMHQLSVRLPREVTVRAAVDGVAISPDGTHLAFTASLQGRRMLWVRPLNSTAAVSLSGTDDASDPFWSPDGRSIGFFAQGKLKRIARSGGPTQTLCDAANGKGGTWNSNDVILFSPDQLDGLYQVSSGGGSPTAVTRVDRANGEFAHSFPSFLPDGRHFLYTVTSAKLEDSWIKIGELGSVDSRPLVRTNSNALVARTEAGDYILFAREGILQAQVFDVARLVVVGEPAQITADRVFYVLSSTYADWAVFSASDTGTLVYRESSGPSQTQLVWVDRSGQMVGSVGAPGWYNHVELSVDGRRVAVDLIDDQSGQSDIWLLDLATSAPSRFTFRSGEFVYPRWAPDGTSLVFGANERHGLYQKLTTKAGTEQVLYDSDDGAGIFPTDWSSDGQFILFRKVPAGTQGGLWLLSLSGDHTAKPVPQTEMRGGNGRFSPDGRWLAYQSNESGRAEVFVQPLPPTGAKWQISQDGGNRPRWRQDGKELYYVSSEGNLMAVPIVLGDTVQVGQASSLFRISAPPDSSFFNVSWYAVSKDGQRFLVFSPQGTPSSLAISVAVNWVEALKK